MAQTWGVIAVQAPVQKQSLHYRHQHKNSPCNTGPSEQTNLTLARGRVGSDAHLVPPQVSVVTAMTANQPLQYRPQYKNTALALQAPLQPISPGSTGPSTQISPCSTAPNTKHQSLQYRPQYTKMSPCSTGPSTENESLQYRAQYRK